MKLTLIMNYSIIFSELLSDIADAFTGDHTHKNSDINEMRQEILDISSTPDSSDDKEVLKDDFNTFLKDTQKAHNSIKEELSNG